MDPSSDTNTSELQVEINRLAERLDVRPMAVGLRTNDGLNIFVDDDGTYHYTTYERGKLVWDDAGTLDDVLYWYCKGIVRGQGSKSFEDRKERFLFEYQVLSHYNPEWAKRRVRELAAMFRDGQPRGHCLTARHRRTSVNACSHRGRTRQDRVDPRTPALGSEATRSPGSSGTRQQVADLEAAGADALVVDLEKASVDEVAEHLRGADAVVFAAGAGPGSGAARKETVDRDAAILLADAAEAAGVDRYVMVSAMAADPQATADDAVFQTYLRAKGVADEAIRARTALNWTIVRPGSLTNDAGTGRVTIAESTGRGSIPRADVAAVLVAVLDEPRTAGQSFDLISGETPIAEAVAALAR